MEIKFKIGDFVTTSWDLSMVGIVKDIYKSSNSYPIKVLWITPNKHFEFTYAVWELFPYDGGKHN